MRELVYYKSNVAERQMMVQVEVEMLVGQMRVTSSKHEPVGLGRVNFNAGRKRIKEEKKQLLSAGVVVHGVSCDSPVVHAQH
ncbi:hypothetical protein EYF80_019527 [Liparis tanakae]|uniref:Uncharacterized protein n=1 Tax=Liparis tanakae TaxID=230148 RepID=A0A4Z2HZB9_9TELE|nr:hypothetical protein EYF80_019527 [Liparis tanakae]